MRNMVIRLAIFGVMAAGLSGVALAQTCPPPGYMLQDGSCYAPPTPGGIVGGVAGFHDGRVGTVLPAEPPRVVERGPSPGTAPGGTVVLRGSRPTYPNIAQPIPGGSGEGYGSTANGPPVSPGLGWDRGFDSLGFDRSGLSP